MNIGQAKETIRNTIRAYLEKDASGKYLFPVTQQRPLLLMGPPGIGKTAIVEQLAAEYGIGLVSYNMTHHTRQSAVGLPHLAEREYDGRTVTVTEYSVSEIIVSVLDCMHDTGLREGILFIDEINCVSETLAPAMLQFLQKKMFGPFRIPDGWVIVAAGNPRAFNRSARDYDVAVLDRLRKLDIEPDLDAWMAFAMKESVHGAILSYLTFHRSHFFLVRGEEGAAEYVTARGWQDLSTLLQSCERLQIKVDEDLILPYLSVRHIAKDFTAFYRLYRKYADDCKDTELPKSFSGWISALAGMADKADRLEENILTGLLLDTLGAELTRCRKNRNLIILAEKRLKRLEAEICDPEPALQAERCLRKWKEALEVRKQYFLISASDMDTEEQLLGELRLCLRQIREEHLSADTAGLISCLQAQQAARVTSQEALCGRLREQLQESLLFAKEYLSEDTLQEFLIQLTANENAVLFFSEQGCDAYFSLSQEMLKPAGTVSRED